MSGSIYHKNSDNDATNDDENLISNLQGKLNKSSLS